jgi:Zn-dependent alcohol dehydrogenase
MKACGICHTDVFISSLPAGIANYPRILGHEGAGVVEEIGPGVTVAQVGDLVLLSYSYCKACDLCNAKEEPYCVKWADLNVVGVEGIFETQQKQNVDGKFFGQSSFAGVSIVSDTSVVNLKGLVRSGEELQLFAPLGCGLMTGVGAVMNAAKPKAHDIVMVTGLGGVGLAAVMAAKIAGCKEIVAVDRVASRLEMAQQLGATQTVDTSKEGADLVENAQKAVNMQPIRYVIETTGVISVINSAIQAMGKNAKLIQVGIPRVGSELTLPLNEFFNATKTFESHLLGNTTGQEMVPKMIQWYREGKFPLEKIVKFFPVEDALKALEGMESGTAIKPVIVW